MTISPDDAWTREDFERVLDERRAGHRDGELEWISDEDLERAAGGHVEAIFGTDTRQDVYAVTDATVKNQANSVAAVGAASDMTISGSNATLKTQTYGPRFGLCSTVRFYSQPSWYGGSAWVLTPRIIATCGHVANLYKLADIRFVFGYRMKDASTPVTTVPTSQVYSARRMLAWEPNRSKKCSLPDWALYELDRAVQAPVVPLTHTLNSPTSGYVYSLGYPSGLPIKYSGKNGFVGDEGFRFLTHLDTGASGSSGSPVFKYRTHEVTGILFCTNAKTWVKSGGCYVAVTEPDSSPLGVFVQKLSYVWQFRQMSLLIDTGSDTDWAGATHPNELVEVSVDGGTTWAPLPEPQGGGSALAPGTTQTFDLASTVLGVGCGWQIQTVSLRIDTSSWPSGARWNTSGFSLSLDGDLMYSFFVGQTFTPSSPSWQGDVNALP